MKPKIINRLNSLNRFYPLILVIFLSAAAVLIEVFFSSMFGLLVYPFDWDTITYVNNGYGLYLKLINNGLLVYFKEIMALKDPIWGFLMSLPFVLGLKKDWHIYLVRIFPMIVFLGLIYRVSKKITNKKFATIMSIISTFTPVFSPHFRFMFESVTLSLAHLRPEIFWTVIMIGTTYYMTENIPKYNSLKYGLISGLLISILILAKASFIPLTIILSFCNIFYYLIKAKKSKNKFKNLGIIILTVTFTSAAWYFLGGLKSAVYYFYYANFSPESSLWKTYWQKTNFLWHMSYYFKMSVLKFMGLPELIFIFLAFFYFFKKKDIPKRYVIYIFETLVLYLVFSISKMKNPISGVSIVLYMWVFAILTVSCLYKKSSKKIRKKVTNIAVFYSIIVIFMLGLGYTSFKNTTKKIDPGKTKPKETYFEVVRDICHQASPGDLVFGRRIFAGHATLRYYLHTKTRCRDVQTQTFSPITDTKKEIVSKLNNSKFVLIFDDVDRYINLFYIRKQEYEDFIFINSYLKNSKEFRLYKSYNIKVYRNIGKIIVTPSVEHLKVNLFVNKSL